MTQSDPLTLFANWFAEAGETDIDKPNAMTLTTVDSSNRPHARIVLLSSFDEHGFVFHTNYNSDKGRDIAHNPQASLSFWWDQLGYQILINGKVEKTTAEESDAYFAKRPRGSQIGAWASEQSHTISNRESLEAKVRQFTEEFEGKDVPRPSHWGGYRVVPDQFEFWVNGADRLHDRFRFTIDDNGNWQSSRLAP
jgi:pyridoxamine 5'-phosphate oxidase